MRLLVDGHVAILGQQADAIVGGDDEYPDGLHGHQVDQTIRPPHHHARNALHTSGEHVATCWIQDL